MVIITFQRIRKDPNNLKGDLMKAQLLSIGHSQKTMRIYPFFEFLQVMGRLSDQEGLLTQRLYTREVELTRQHPQVSGAGIRSVDNFKFQNSCWPNIIAMGESIHWQKCTSREPCQLYKKWRNPIAEKQPPYYLISALSIVNTVCTLLCYLTISGKYQKAEQNWENSLKIRQELESQHPLDVAISYQHLASLNKQKGLYIEAGVDRFSILTAQNKWQKRQWRFMTSMASAALVAPSLVILINWHKYNKTRTNTRRVRKL